MAQLVKNPLEMGGSLGWEDLLEKEIVTKSSIAWSIRGGILAWKIPRTEETGRLYHPRGCKESDRTEHLSTAK